METNIVVLILLFGILAGIFLIIFTLINQKKKTSEINKVLNTRVFLVSVPKETMHHDEGNTPPKDYRQLIAVAEQMYASLASLYSSDWGNKLLKDQEQISFEIVGQGNLIYFYVACPKMFEEMVEKQIHSYYPNAHIERAKTPNIFNLGEVKAEIVCAHLGLTKKNIVPIKTYQNLESDSLSAITTAFSKLGEGSNAALQIIVRPTSNDWQNKAQQTAKKIQEGKTGGVYKESTSLKVINSTMGGITNIVHGAAKPEETGKDKDPYKPIQLTPMQENLLKAINDKVAKTGLETIIRVVSVAQDKAVASANLHNILSGFAQFGTPELNSFKVSSGNMETVKDYILRRFSGKGLVLNTEELATIFHFPSINIDTPNMKWLLAKELAPPANLPNEGTIIGKSVYRGVENMIRIKQEDRRRHIFMIGKTGVGKTTLFKNMFEQDMLEGKGCCYIDPLGDAIEDLLGKIPPERAQDVILFDPSDAQYPFGLNLLEFHSPEERDFLIQEAIQIFYKLFDPGQTGIVGPQWEHWFRNAALTIMSQPEGGTLIDVPRIFTDDAYRNKLVSNVTDLIVKGFWEQQLAKTADFHKSEMYNYFISKFGRFMTNDVMRNIIGQKKSSFNIRQIMDENKILLVNLSKGKIGEINSSLFGMIIVTKIQLAAFSRADTPEEERRDFYLYVDEFQNFTTDSFATILSEARKYHLNLNVTNQYIAQLTEQIRDAVIGNAGTMISYRIGAADAEFMAKEFPGLTVSDLTNVDQYNTYVKLLIDGTPSKPFSMKGIKSELASDANVREQTRNLSRQNYGRPVAQIAQEIEDGFKNSSPAAPGANEPLRNL